MTSLRAVPRAHDQGHLIVEYLMTNKPSIIVYISPLGTKIKTLNIQLNCKSSIRNKPSLIVDLARINSDEQA